MLRQKYWVLTDGYILGQFYKRGDAIMLTRKQAKYELMAGVISPRKLDFDGDGTLEDVETEQSRPETPNAPSQNLDRWHPEPKRWDEPRSEKLGVPAEPAPATPVEGPQLPEASEVGMESGPVEVTPTPAAKAEETTATLPLDGINTPAVIQEETPPVAEAPVETIETPPAADAPVLVDVPADAGQPAEAEPVVVEAPADPLPVEAPDAVSVEPVELGVQQPAPGELPSDVPAPAPVEVTDAVEAQPAPPTESAPENGAVDAGGDAVVPPVEVPAAGEPVDALPADTPVEAPVEVEPVGEVVPPARPAETAPEPAPEQKPVAADLPVAEVPAEPVGEPVLEEPVLADASALDLGSPVGPASDPAPVSEPAGEVTDAPVDPAPVEPVASSVPPDAEPVAADPSLDVVTEPTDAVADVDLVDSGAGSGDPAPVAVDEPAPAPADAGGDVPVAADPVDAAVGADPAGGGEQPAPDGVDASEPAEAGRVEPVEVPAEEPAAEAPKENP
jgi:hypothetical protein